MKVSLNCISLVILLVAIVSYAEPQYYPYNYGYYTPYIQAVPNPDNLEQQAIYRSGVPQTYHLDNVNDPANRFLLGSVSINTATTTLTETTVTSTTCTTSTSALSICIASARRRRGLALDNGKHARGLFYDDQQNEDDFDSIFVPIEDPKKDQVAPEVVKSSELPRPAREVVVPFIIEPGFNAPAEFRGGRALFSFGVSTITTTFTSTYTASLKAKCRSVTGYRICDSEQITGKK